MLLLQELNNIFKKVQICATSHQKYQKTLQEIYLKYPNEEFVQKFKEILIKVFICPNQIQEKYILQLLNFCSSFIISVTEENGKNVSTECSEDTSTHPFLSDMFLSTLKYCNSSITEVRYRSCHFITLLLKHLGEDTFLDNDICDMIQEAMLERITDWRPLIRCEAVTALARLQDPMNPECPVIRAFITSIEDPATLVRRHVVDVIAISASTVPKIVERVRDVEASVRLACYNKCTIIGPKHMKIEHRQAILKSGFTENDKTSKNCFLQKLLPRWLSCYNGDYLQLLKSVKLDAYEADFKVTEFLNTNLLEVYFKTNPITEIIGYLPIDETKTVPLNKLTSETTIFWRVLTNYLKRNEEDIVETILPDLPVLCDYIYSFHKEKYNNSFEVWDFYEFQTILANLLLILEEYDFSDEVGKKKIHHLIETLLLCTKHSQRVIDKLIAIYAKLTKNMDIFTTEVCNIISNFREPLIDQTPSAEQIQEQQFKMAQLRVKINVLQEDFLAAMDKQDFEQAALIKSEMTSLQRKAEEVELQIRESTKTKPVRNETEMNYHTLDVLRSMLKLLELKQITVAIEIVATELIIPFLKSTDPELYAKAAECLGLCCLLEYNWAEKYLKSISLPFLLYRVVPKQNKNQLMTSIRVLSDLAIYYGAKLFKKNENVCSIADTTTVNADKRQLNKTRRLYTVNDMEDLNTIAERCITLDELIDVLLDILDDEQEDVRYCAAQGLCNLLRNGTINSPSIVARLFLKWSNPITEKHHIKLQQLLGNSLFMYAKNTDGSGEVLAEAVFPIISSISNAPPTSPLADINIENTLKFLAAMTSIRKKKGFVNAHSKIAQSICHKISNKPDDPVASFYAKMFCYLEPPLEDPVVARELKQQIDVILQSTSNKIIQKNLIRYKSSLINYLNESNESNSPDNEKEYVENIQKNTEEENDHHEENFRSIEANSIQNNSSKNKDTIFSDGDSTSTKSSADSEENIFENEKSKTSLGDQEPRLRQSKRLKNHENKEINRSHKQKCREKVQDSSQLNREIPQLASNSRQTRTPNTFSIGNTLNAERRDSKKRRKNRCHSKNSNVTEELTSTTKFSFSKKLVVVLERTIDTETSSDSEVSFVENKRRSKRLKEKKEKDH